MVTSFHFPGRPGKETKQRKGAAGQAKNPCRFISGLNVGAAFRRNSTGCGTRPGVRSPDGASCAVTGIFLMAGVIKPLTCGAASKVRRLKNKKAAHTVRPAPLTLALTFLIHFNDYIKKNHSPAYTLHSLACVYHVTCDRVVSFMGRLYMRTTVRIQGWLPEGKPTQLHRLRTAVNEVCGSASPDRESPSSKDGPEGADTTFLKCTYTHFSCLALPYVRENVAFSPAPAPPENLLSNTGAAPRPCRLRPVPAKREKNRPVASAAAPV